MLGCRLTNKGGENNVSITTQLTDNYGKTVSQCNQLLVRKFTGKI